LIKKPTPEKGPVVRANCRHNSKNDQIQVEEGARMTTNADESKNVSQAEDDKQDAKAGGLSGFMDKVLGRDKKEPESRTTEHFLDQLYKPEMPQQAGPMARPLAGEAPLSHEENLTVLARTQNVDGSWQDEVEMTAAALLAFVRASHTTHTGSYRHQAQKAMTWLLKRLPTARGFAAFAALRALDDLYAASGEGEVSEVLRHSLPAATSDAERAAMGEQVAVPETLDNLDAVRIAALVQGYPRLTMPNLQSDEGMIAQVWGLVGTPKGA